MLDKKKRFHKLIVSLLVTAVIITQMGFTSKKGEAAVIHNVAYTVYVSTNGSDSGDGSKDAPFQTIKKAQEKVRSLDKTKGDIVVEIADGTYELNEELKFDENDSGNENCTIIYKAADGAKPLISGGKKLNSKWEEATEVNWLKGGLKAYKTTLNRDDKLRAIYVNGTRASMTRKTATPIKTVGTYVVKKGQADWAWKDGSGLQKNGVFVPFKKGNVFSSSFLPANARNPHNIELETVSRWIKNTVCADTLEATGDGTQVNFQMPYGVIAQNLGWETEYNPSGSNEVVNVYEWLSKEGEFYFDQAGSSLYYIPRSGENMSTAEVVVPELVHLVDVRGSEPLSTYAHDITFEGLSFAYSDWNLYELDGSHGNATVQACTILTKFADSDQHNDIYRSYDMPPAAITVNTAKNIKFLDGEIKLTGYLGIHLENDVWNCEVTGNYIGQTGGAGIVVGHLQHVYENDTDDIQVNSGNAGADKEHFACGTESVPQNITISNNYLLENCYFFPGNSPITTFYTKNLQLLHNFVYKCSYSGMSIGWGWCEFDGTDGTNPVKYGSQSGNSKSRLPGNPTTTCRNNHVNYNRVEEICSLLMDAGGIYTLGQMGDEDENGNWVNYSEMSNNYINCFRADTKDDMSRMVNGFHPDEGSAYIKFDRNVVTNTIRNVYEMNDWKRKHDLTVTNGFTNSERCERNAPSVVYETTVNADYIWPVAGYMTVLNSGLEDKYVHMVGKDVIADTEYELASNVRVAGGEELPRRGLLSDADKVWLAPEGTTDFAEGANMTKAAGNDKSITVPETTGKYKLYIQYADSSLSDASKFTLYVGESTDITNVRDGRDYNVSEARPFQLKLDDEHYTFTLNGNNVTSGYEISEAGVWTIKSTNKETGAVDETLIFSTTITDANKLLTKSVTVNAGDTIEFAQNLGDSTKTIWLAPTGLSAFDKNSDTMSWVAGDSTSMKAPLKTEGSTTYLLTVVDGNGTLSQSDATVTISGMAVVTPVPDKPTPKVTASTQTPAVTQSPAAPASVAPVNNDKNVIEVAKPKLKGVKNVKGKKIKVTLKAKVKSANGYEIRYSKKSSMTASKKVIIKKNSILSKIITKLTKGKKYFVQVRAYKTVGGKKYYSKWSAKKSVSIKK